MAAVEFTPYGWPEPGPLYLERTTFLDYDHPAVAQFVSDALAPLQGAGKHNGTNKGTERERAVALFMATRDRIRYNPFNPGFTAQSFSASHVVTAGEAFCIPKAALLVAACRAAGIHAAVGLSDVVNHFTSDKLKAAMGGREVFIDHGYAAMYVDGKWLKAVPAFNRELCERMGVEPTAFDGTHDAILQTMNENGETVDMRYLRDHGFWSDLPYQRIRDDFLGYYPESMWKQETT